MLFYSLSKIAWVLKMPVQMSLLRHQHFKPCLPAWGLYFKLEFSTHYISKENFHELHIIF